MNNKKHRWAQMKWRTWLIIVFVLVLRKKFEFTYTTESLALVLDGDWVSQWRCGTLNDMIFSLCGTFANGIPFRLVDHLIAKIHTKKLNSISIQFYFMEYDICEEILNYRFHIGTKPYLKLRRGTGSNYQLFNKVPKTTHANIKPM